MNNMLLIVRLCRMVAEFLPKSGKAKALLLQMVISHFVSSSYFLQEKQKQKQILHFATTTSDTITPLLSAAAASWV